MNKHIKLILQSVFALALGGEVFGQQIEKIDIPIQTSEKFQEKIEKALKSNKRKIDQFTTNEEKEIIYSEIGKSINADGEQIISFECQKNYKIEKKAFTVDVKGDPIVGYSAKAFKAELNKYYSFALNSKQSKPEVYLAQNAYGAQVQVKKVIVNEFALVSSSRHLDFPFASTQNMFPNITVPYEKNYIRLAIDISFEPSLARANEKKILCAFKFNLISPYYIDYSSNYAPTIDSPLEVDRRIKGFTTQFISLIVFNNSTGEVYYEARGR